MLLPSQPSLIGSEGTGRSRRSSTLQEHLRTFLIELHWTDRPRLECREPPRSYVEQGMYSTIIGDFLDRSIQLHTRSLGRAAGSVSVPQIQSVVRNKRAAEVSVRVTPGL